MVEGPGEYTLRTYEKGDEIEFVDLFNEAYKEYAGFVRRTPEYWSWCCETRPSVEKNGICVVEKDQKIVGYAVVGISIGRIIPREVSAEVFEICYDPAYDGKTIISKLLEWTTSYARSKNIDFVILNAPSDDGVFKETCEELEFSKKQHAILVLRVIKFSKLIQEIITHQKQITRYNGHFLINLTNAPTLPDGDITIQIQNGAVSVLEGKVGVPDVTLKTDVKTLLACIFEQKGILRTIFSSRLRIHPFWKFLKAVRLLSALRVDSPWFVPGGDFG